MPIISHPMTPADRDAMTALRARLAASPITMTRAAFDALVEATPAADGVEYREGDAWGVKGTWCVPAGAAPGRALLYLHGGAFVFGSARAFRRFVGQLAARAGLAAFVADYRLAPEHPFPAAWDDARTAHRALAAEMGASRVVIAGDSAGGGLALSLLRETTEAPCGLLFSPWTDLALTGESVTTRAHDDPLLSRAALEAGVRAYLRGDDARDPRVSPLRGAPLRPPVQVHVGTAEILLDDSVRLDRLAGAEVHVWEGLPHVFPRSLAQLEGARAALDLASSWVRHASRL